ncbi:MAG: hypothetical protein H5T45_06070 [Thermoplasmatales archaeon]|jgi:hypothetical protein|nr:hypothetical protein [Thermoplasmatales archaeon]
MKVECKKCGKEYTLDDDENVGDYVCECGGELQKVSTLGDFIPALLITIVIQFFFGIWWELLPLGIISVIILWSERKTTPSNITLSQKIFVLWLIVYSLFVLLTVLWSLFQVVI